MGGLKDIRTRIDSVKSTQQITSAMKLVAASKLRKAQNAILTMRPYAAKLQEILQNLSSSLENSEDGIYSQVRPEENILIIPMSSNRGLCGAFNANIIKATKKHIAENYADQYEKGSVYILTIGKKVTEMLTKDGYQVIESHDEILNSGSFEEVATLAEKLMKDFADKKFDKVEFIYNAFKNAASQFLTVEQFLPVLPPENVDENDSNSDYIFEPSKEEILEELIPKSLKIQFYKNVLDSIASEHGARMTAMHQATDNASELLKDLQLTYNKARQASITNEILEIVSGAEALKG
jgi:F-type H+-transporting ATPase subunit gamma